MTALEPGRSLIALARANSMLSFARCRFMLGFHRPNVTPLSVSTRPFMNDPGDRFALARSPFSSRHGAVVWVQPDNDRAVTAGHTRTLLSPRITGRR